MREKEIEKIPYITLPACDPDGRVSYIGRTAWRNIGHERYIILEVYANREGCLQVPVVRYVASKRDWGVYHTDTGRWSKRRIEGHIWGKGLCWHDEMVPRRRGMGQEDRLYGAEDLSRIRNFFQGIKVWNEERWWEYFTQNEDRIKNGRADRKARRRKEGLRERDAATPVLDKEELTAWAEGKLFQGRHYLYYKKYGQRADVCCSACGAMDSGRWKAGISYESMFERHIQEPREGMIGRCRFCGEHGTYKPQGKAKVAYREREHAFLVDRYLDKGVVVRYIEVCKTWQLEETYGEKGLEMREAHEETGVVEIARTYLLPGKKTQTDYHKHDPYLGRDFWDDCNLCGMPGIRIDKAVVYPTSYENLKGTFGQYCALREHAEAVGKLNVKGYLERYMEFPQIEMLAKMGMHEVIERMVGCECGIINDSSADRMDRFLGIRKDKVRMLVEQKGEIGILKVLQKEWRLGANWTWQQVMGLAEIDAWGKDLETALEVMSVQRLLNIISGYAGCGYGTGCSHAVGRLECASTEYLDYLRMRKELGYDLDNTVYQRPRDLHTAHDQMAAEQDRKKEDERRKKVAREFPQIRKNYRRLRKKYFYEDDKYLIRPARSAEEIVMEGRALHHCVGGENYLRKHNEGEAYILMLRFVEMPETPYVTVEVRGTSEILQWYGANDRKPNEEVIQEWLDRYMEMLKSGSLGAERETVGEEGMLMAAV